MSIRRGVLWGGALLILLIIAIDAYEAWSDRRAVVAQAGHSLLATSYALS